MKNLILIILFSTSLTFSQNINDPYWDTQYWLRAMNVHSFWTAANTDGNSDVVIAVLGLGVEITHEDLADNIWVNPWEVPNDGIDDDENGYIDDYNGWNVIDNNSNVLPSNYNHEYAHETYVSGIIAAVKNNNKGITGIAPRCKILPVKFYEFSKTPNWYADKLIAAFNYVRDLQVQFSQKRFVINLSYAWSPNDFSPNQLTAITNAILQCYELGIPIFCSAGNNRSRPVGFPANLWFTNSVAELWRGINNEFNEAGGSNVGPENTFAAAGEGSKITSYNNDYRGFNGASFSTPVAAGIAALLLSVNNDLTPSQIRNIMISSTHKVGGVNYNWNPEMPGHSRELGYGKLDAYNCLVRGFLNFYFANDVEGNFTDFGQIKVNGIWYPTNTDVPIIVGDQVSVVAQNDMHNYNGYNNRFHSWSYVSNELYRRQLQNQFLAKYDETPEILARYRKTRPLTIRNYFEGGNGGNIIFGEKDFDVTNRISPFNENAFIFQAQNVEVTYRAEANQTHTNLFGTNWKFIQWENGSTNRIREEQINQNTSSEWRAIYKGIQRTDNSNAYNKNNQRKTVRTPDGILHAVYESLNKVWYEKSTDNGLSWFIVNNGLPVSNNEAKSPSINFYGNEVQIVWQEKFGNNFKIKIAVFGYISLYSDIVTESNLPFSFDASPTIAVGNGGKTLVVWKGYDQGCSPFGMIALKFASGYATTYGIVFNQFCKIDNSDQYSQNPSLASDYTYYPTYFHLAWEQQGTIRYCKLQESNGNITQTDYSIISNGSSFMFHS